MKIEKKKLVFAGIMAAVVLFIISYSFYTFDGDYEPEIDTNKIPVPELVDEQEEYNTKLEAIDALKEERERLAPSVYDEKYLNSEGFYDTGLLDKEKIRLVDSIYELNRKSYADYSYHEPFYDKNEHVIEKDPKPKKMETIPENKVTEQHLLIESREIGLEHQLLFASNPMKKEEPTEQKKDVQLMVRVDGTQVVKQDFRLQMRTTQDIFIDGKQIPKNTMVYGFVSFKPNRTLLKISNIDGIPVALKAYDLADQTEGIYIKNTFRNDLKQEVLGDVVDDVNIAGVPQVSGIKKIFQRSNRQVKVTVVDNYKLILKSKS